MPSVEFDTVEHGQLSDEALLSQVVRGDPHALATLYDRHAQGIYNLIVRIVQEQTSADEILQDTFWQIWRSAGEFRPGNAGAWFYRIARNKSLDWLRRKKTRPQTVISLDETGVETPQANIHVPVERTIAHSWRQEHIQQALTHLPVEQRLCLELAYFDGMSQRQIAESMQTPVSTVKTRIQLGLEKLQRILVAVGYRSGEVE